MVAAAGVGAGAAALVLQPGGGPVELAEADPAARPARSESADARPLERLDRWAGALEERPEGAVSPELLQVLVEIRDELRALRTAGGSAGATDAGAASKTPDASPPPAAAASGPMIAPPNPADIEAAIRTGEAMVLGREIARCRNYMEMLRHEHAKDAADADGAGKADDERAVLAYDEALRNLSTVRSFRELMQFYSRWDDHDDVDVVYPKWDR